MPVRARLGRWWIGCALVAAAGLAVPVHPSAQAAGPARRVAAVDASNVREWDARITRLERHGQLRLKREDADALVGGRIHERLDQYHRGVRVFGGEIVRQLDRGQTVSVFGTLYGGIDVGVEPSLSASDAAAAVERLSGVPPGTAPELVVLPRDEGGFVLAYRARVVTPADVIVYFVDAADGSVALQYSNRQTAVGTGTGVRGDTKKVSTTLRSGRYVMLDGMRPPAIYTFDLKGDFPRALLYLNGLVMLNETDLASDDDNVWTDPAAVDAHAYAGWTYDYFYKRFSRAGLDGRNLAMSSVVHPVRREAWASVSSATLNTYYLNAFYAGDGIMVYGEGLPDTVTAGGVRWAYFSGALDVVAHELTHGVTDYTSGLIYRNESGALNESFSDIMGTAVEFYYQPAGTGYLKADYLLGEDLTSPQSGFRSMANPQAYGDPDHYSRRLLGESDNGGVHSNSGIANQAFYLAVEGGTNRTSGLSVTGVGSANREQIEKVFYRAMTQLLPANATFAMARAATLQAARDLYGSSSVENVVARAWTAVGVN